MIQKTSIIAQKPSAGWNTSLELFLGDKRGSGLTVIFIGLTGILLVLLVFLSIADYALYSTKRNQICHGINYAVCAAIQEIDRTKSEEGLASGFDENIGMALVDEIVLDEEQADNAFFSTLKANTGIKREAVSGNTLIVTVSPKATGLDIILRNDTTRIEGSVGSPELLEPAINSAVERLWQDSSPEQDRHVIYVNGNLETNQFQKVPYYMVFIKDYQIDGLFRKRTATFVGFAGAKIERRK